jgi:hypothetical protein
MTPPLYVVDLLRQADAMRQARRRRRARQLTVVLVVVVVVVLVAIGLADVLDWIDGR